MTARLMLERKGIDYKRVDLMPVVSKLVVRLLRFPGNTVPALRLDGRRIQGSTEIAHELDRMVPEPPLFPSDPDQRTEVERAERWGDVDLQSAVRRILWNAIPRDRPSLGTFAEGARLGVPIGVALRTAAPIVALAIRFNEANDENVRADLAALPGMLARIEDWIDAGVLGGDELNAADLQIATSLRLLMSLDDVRPAIERSRAGELARRAVPDFPGRIAPAFPATWLEPLHAAQPAVAAA